MKKIIAIAAIIASAQASAFWNNDNGYTNADSRFDSNGYGYGDAYGKGDAAGSGDFESEFTMTFKGRAKGDAKTNWDGNANGYQNMNSNFDGQGYGYNQPYYGYAPVAPVAPEAK